MNEATAPRPRSQSPDYNQPPTRASCPDVRVECVPGYLDGVIRLGGARRHPPEPYRHPRLHAALRGSRQSRPTGRIARAPYRLRFDFVHFRLSTVRNCAPRRIVNEQIVRTRRCRPSCARLISRPAARWPLREKTHTCGLSASGLQQALRRHARDGTANRLFVIVAEGGVAAVPPIEALTVMGAVAWRSIKCDVARVLERCIGRLRGRANRAAQLTQAACSRSDLRMTARWGRRLVEAVDVAASSHPPQGHQSTKAPCGVSSIHESQAESESGAASVNDRQGRSCGSAPDDGGQGRQT